MIHFNFIVTPSYRGIGIIHSCKGTPFRRLSPSMKQTAVPDGVFTFVTALLSKQGLDQLCPLSADKTRFALFTNRVVIACKRMFLIGEINPFDSPV
jgi:hypothetical protein